MNMVSGGVVHIVIAGLLVFSCGLTRAEPQNGETFKHWTIRCDAMEGEALSKPCYVFQNLIMKEGGSRILHIAAGLHPQNKERVVVLITMPLGISLPPGASLQVDDNESIKFIIERCERGGCRGGFVLTDSMKRQFEEGESALVTFFDASREPIEVSVSLNGFSEGLMALN